MLAQVRGGSLAERRAAAVEFDWNRGDLNRLGWMMSQKNMDLATAAQVFLAGHPEQFNHVHKREIADGDRPRCNLLDAIHKRLVAGFYLPDPDADMGDVRAEMLQWIEKQHEDEAAGRRGRWCFRADLFEPLTLDVVRRDDPEAMREAIDKEIFAIPDRPRRVGLLRELFSSILG